MMGVTAGRTFLVTFPLHVTGRLGSANGVTGLATRDLHPCVVVAQGEALFAVAVRFDLHPRPKEQGSSAWQMHVGPHAARPLAWQH